MFKKVVLTPIITALTAILAAMLLAACGGGGGSDSTTAAAPSPAPVPSGLASGPGPTMPSKMVLAYYSGFDQGYNALTKYYASFNAVAVDYWNITGTGDVVDDGDSAADAMAFLKSKNIPIYACISNIDTDWSPSIAHNVTTGNRTVAIANLLAFAQQNGLAGINIDFENLDQADRANLSSFAADLANVLHANGLKLIISVPAFSSADETDPYNMPYDLAALGNVVDYLQVMTYDESTPDWSPGPVAGSDWMQSSLSYAVSKVPAAKILSGLPAYGYDWASDSSSSAIFWTDVPGLLTQYGIKPTFDTPTSSLTFGYTAADGIGHTVWIENTQSIALKAAMVNTFGLGGTSVYALGMEDQSFWDALHSGLGQ
jgi:spore germination protein YaaH